MRCAAFSGASHTMVMREVSAARLADRQRDDVDVEAAEERGDAGEDAGFVLYECDECVEHVGYPFSVLSC